MRTKFLSFTGKPFELGTDFKFKDDGTVEVVMSPKHDKVIEVLYDSEDKIHGVRFKYRSKNFCSPKWDSSDQGCRDIKAKLDYKILTEVEDPFPEAIDSLPLECVVI